jgi:hypothetical protein
MASMDTLNERIFSKSEAWKRILGGGLLCLSIIGIPFAAGYLFRYSLQVRNNGDTALPAWRNLPAQLMPGIHFLGVFAAWSLLPYLITVGLGWLLEFITFGVLWWVAYLICMVGLALSPVLGISALYHYQNKRDWSALLDYRSILLPLNKLRRQLVIPCIAWSGLITLFLPLLPFAFFLGFVVLLAYLVPLLEQE